MVLYCSCNFCKSEIIIREAFNDRGEIKKLYGDTYSILCPRCEQSNQVAGNRVHAKESKFSGLIFLILLASSFLIGYFLYDYIGTKSIQAWLIVPSISSIPVIVYFIYKKIDNNKIRQFNYYRL